MELEEIWPLEDAFCVGGPVVPYFLGCQRSEFRAQNVRRGYILAVVPMECVSGLGVLFPLILGVHGLRRGEGWGVGGGGG